MTTNIFEVNSKTIACDSRWSVDNDESDFILYSDKTGFKKLISFNDNSIVFAGYLKSVNNWILWFLGGFKSTEIPSADGVSLSIINARGEIKYTTESVKILEIKDFVAAFSGSGSDFAIPKWDRNIRTRRNSNVSELMDFAVLNDIYTGGELTIKKIEEVTQKDHSCTPCDFEEFNRVFLETGYVFMKNTGKIVRYNDAEASIKSSVEEMRGRSMMNFAAPFYGMHKNHTKEESEKIALNVRSCLLGEREGKKD